MKRIPPPWLGLHQDSFSLSRVSSSLTSQKVQFNIFLAPPIAPPQQHRKMATRSLPLPEYFFSPCYQRTLHFGLPLTFCPDPPKRKKAPPDLAFTQTFWKLSSTEQIIFPVAFVTLLNVHNFPHGELVCNDPPLSLFSHVRYLPQ